MQIGKIFFVTKNLENTNNILMTKSQGYLKQDDLIIHYHCLITISELHNDSFLTVSGDSEIISYVHIRLNTLKKNKNITFTKD